MDDDELTSAARERLTSNDAPIATTDTVASRDASLTTLLAAHVRALRSPEDYTDLATAATALAQLGTPGIEALVAILVDPGAGNEARRRAALALGQSGDARALAPLVAALHDDAERYLPMAAAIALGALRMGEAVPALVEALQDPTNQYGATAWEALVLIGQASTPALATALAAGPTGPVGATSQRRLAARALGRLGQAGDARTLEPLRAALHDADPLVRWEAVSALGWARGEQAVQDVRPLLQDPDPDVRSEVIHVLAWAGTPDDLDALKHLRRHDTARQWEGEQVRDVAAWAMKQIRGRARAQARAHAHLQDSRHVCG